MAQPSIDAVLAGTKGFAVALLAPVTTRVGMRPRVAADPGQVLGLCGAAGGLVVVEFMGEGSLAAIQALVRDARRLRVVAGVPAAHAGADETLRALGVEVARWDGKVEGMLGAIERALGATGSAPLAGPSHGARCPRGPLRPRRLPPVPAPARQASPPAVARPPRPRRPGPPRVRVRPWRPAPAAPPAPVAPRPPPRPPQAAAGPAPRPAQPAPAAPRPPVAPSAPRLQAVAAPPAAAGWPAAAPRPAVVAAPPRAARSRAQAEAAPIAPRPARSRRGPGGGRSDRSRARARRAAQASPRGAALRRPRRRRPERRRRRSGRGAAGPGLRPASTSTPPASTSRRPPPRASPGPPASAPPTGRGGAPPALAGGAQAGEPLGAPGAEDPGVPLRSRARRAGGRAPGRRRDPRPQGGGDAPAGRRGPRHRAAGGERHRLGRAERDPREIDALLAEVAPLLAGAPAELVPALQTIRNALVSEAIDFSEAAQRVATRDRPAPFRWWRSARKAGAARVIENYAERERAPERRRLWPWIGSALSLAAGVGAYHVHRLLTLPKPTAGGHGRRSARGAPPGGGGGTVAPWSRSPAPRSTHSSSRPSGPSRPSRA